MKPFIILGLCASLTGCTERIVYVTIDSDAGITRDDGATTSTMEDAAGLVGEDARNVVISDDTGGFPECPGLSLNEARTYRAERNTCVGPLVNARVVNLQQARISTCTATGQVLAEYCDSVFIPLYFSGDWEPVGVGSRGVRFPVTCGGVRYDCLLTMLVAASGQVDLSCVSGVENCSIHWVEG